MCGPDVQMGRADGEEEEGEEEGCQLEGIAEEEPGAAAGTCTSAFVSRV